MVHYYETRASLVKTMDTGMEKRVTEDFLVEASSCSEAEVRTSQMLAPYIRGEFTVSVAKAAKITEVYGEGSGKYWLGKVEVVTYDEGSGREKRTLVHVLVGAACFKEAYDVLKDGMSGTVSDMEVVSLSLTRILEVIH